MDMKTNPDVTPPAAGLQENAPDGRTNLVLAHFLTSIASGLVVIVMAIFLWWLLNLQEDRYTLVSTARVAERVQQEINTQLADRLNALRRMVHRWQTIPGIDNDEWVRDASYLVQDQPGYAWIARTDNKGWIDWTIAAPSQPDQPANDDILSIPGAIESIAETVKWAQGNTLTPLDLSNTSIERDFFLIIMPQTINGQKDGAIIAGIDSANFFNIILNEEMTRDYIVRIHKRSTDEDVVLYDTSGTKNDGDIKFLQQTTAGTQPVTWDITVTPTSAKVAEERSSLPNFVLAAGVMIALLLGYAIRQRQLAHQRETMASRLGRIMNQSSNEIYFFDAETLQFVNVNDGALRNLGYTAREALSLHPYDIKPEFDEKSFRKTTDPLLRGEKEQLVFQTHHRCKDGSTYPVEVNLQISGDTEHRLFFAVAQDLSERKRAAYERQRYMAMINNNRDLIAVVSPKTNKFTFVNKGAVKALGYTEAELLDMTPEDLRSSDDAGEFLTEARKILEGKEDLIVYDVQYRCKNGDVLDLEVQLMPIVDFSGEKALLGIGRDITERKKNAAELERARFELERRARDLLRSNQELQQFAYAASHDLQEPLRMVSSYLQLLEEEYTRDLDEEAHEYIRFAVDGANRMRDLIYDLLAFSQVETQGKPFATVDCTQVVDTALNDLSGPINESGVMITYENLPIVRGDYGQLVQLFTNLIGNAIKYRKEKDPKVHIEAKKSGGVWEVSIIDNGIGINEKFHNRIFEIFKRLHTADEYKGTGIGLALCKRIVERHGGTIGVHDNPLGGSIFYFTLNSFDQDKDTEESPTTNQTATKA